MNKELLMFLCGGSMIFSGLVLLLPALAACLRGEPEMLMLLAIALLTMALGGGLYYAGRNHRRNMTIKESAAIINLVWAMLTVVGMLPFWLSGSLDLAQSLFESVSAITTVGVNLLPPDAADSIYLWRATIGWLGGLNFVIGLVTVIPQVSGCFGMTISVQQYLSYSPVLKRMAKLALRMALIYTGFTLVSAALFCLAGLSNLDAMLTAMLTLSTTGGADHSLFAAMNSPLVELVAILSMLFACGNLGIYTRIRNLSDIKIFARDPELKVFLGIIIGFGLLVAFHLWKSGVYGPGDSLRYGFFQVLSFISTTGFMATPANTWPDFDRFVLVLLLFVGGCIGSATGGIKVLRFIVLFKLAVAEAFHTLHPHMVVSIKVGDMAVPRKIAGRILAFFFMYALVFFVFTLLLSLSGITLAEAAAMAMACLTGAGNAGGLASMASFQALPEPLMMVACFFMILGRMEIFSFLLLLQAVGGERRHKW